MIIAKIISLEWTPEANNTEAQANADHSIPLLHSIWELGLLLLDWGEDFGGSELWKAHSWRAFATGYSSWWRNIFRWIS
jgi:hypothetical protein